MSPAPPLLAARSRADLSVFCRLSYCPGFTFTPPAARSIHTTISYPRTIPQLPARLAIRSFISPSSTSPLVTDSSPAASPTLTFEQYITSIAPPKSSSATISPSPSPSASSSSGSGSFKLIVVLAATLAPIVFILLTLIILWVFVYRHHSRRRHDQATRGTNEDEEAEWEQVMISAQAGPFSMPIVQRLAAPLRAASVRALSIKSDAPRSPTSLNSTVAEEAATSLASSGSASSNKASLAVTVTPPQPPLTREHILARTAKPRLWKNPVASSGGVFMPNARIVPPTPTEEDGSTLATSVGPSTSSEKTGLPVKLAEPPMSPYTSPRDAPVPAPVMLSRAPTFKSVASFRGEPPPEYARPLPRTPS